ncbi:hypothetical protein EWH99_04480 [Sporolactobacillus sp. THM7-7]|nr:hypothetical protein EWH99_04480 [Sporolactobacillus sp. THM7-7]
MMTKKEKKYLQMFRFIDMLILKESVCYRLISTSRVSNLKKFWLIVVIILCLAVIIGGRFYWNYKIDHTSMSAVQTGSDVIAGGSSESVESGKNIKAHIENLPKSMQKAAEEAETEDGQVQVILIGDKNAEALATQLQEKMDQTFGDLFFKVTGRDMGKSTSLELNHAKLSDLFQNVNGKPDAVIYTPPVYNDDHQVSTDDTNTVISLFEEKVHVTYPDAAFFVSPPSYSPERPYINERIDDMETYAKEQKIQYLDYLSKWPKGEKRSQLVGNDGETMNKSGQKIWMDYISDRWGLSK